MRFVGRKEELSQLENTLLKKGSALVTIQGRRRIGKSTLIKYFAKINDYKLIEFQGLAPRRGLTNRHQLDNFSKTLAIHLNVKKIYLDDWSQAFSQLQNLKISEKTIILFDEISWMGGKDPDFAGKLKQEWDKIQFNKFPLKLVLCGSVSSWIEYNILKNTSFVGRVNLEIFLRELSIAESSNLLDHTNKKINSKELAEILSITGGVPKYLEAIDIKKTAENNIKLLCYQPSGFLYSEFEKIFSDIFGKKNTLYSNILKTLIHGPMSPSDLVEKLNLEYNGDFTDYVRDLELAGFIRRDYTWDLKNQRESKNSVLRVSDNYARFYLNYIFPYKSRIEKKPIKLTDSLHFISWPQVIGYQFENLILNNINTLTELLDISNSEIIQLGPYFQKQSSKKQGVQIDFLIQCKRNTIHLCEFKSGNQIGLEVVHDVETKIKKIKLPKGYSLRPHLIYIGNLTTDLLENDFFDKKISFDKFTRP